MFTRILSAASVLVTLVPGAETAIAQPATPDPPAMALRAGVMLSIQPAGHANPPYLSVGLGGMTPGVNLAIDLAADRLVTLALELSTTMPMRVTQVGRYVTGRGPVTASHRDTLLSLLPGVRLGEPAAAWTVRAGPSALFGTPERDPDEIYQDAAGALAWTFGADRNQRLKRGSDLRYVLRYSLASRRDDAAAFGLGRHIVRVGVEYRWRP